MSGDLPQRHSFLMAAYARLLHLYPRHYRLDYGEEMLLVFRQMIISAGAQGRSSLLRMAWRESCDLPLALWRAHKRDWRRKRMEANSTDSGVGDGSSRWRLLLYVAPFAGAVAFIFLGWPRVFLLFASWLAPVRFFGLLLLILALTVAGLRRGLPRWALPSVGFVFAIIGMMLFSSWISLLPAAPPYTGDIWVKIRHALLNRLIYSGHVLLLALLLLLLAARLPSLRSFYLRVRYDWTLLSFMLYGALILTVLLGDDISPGQEPFQLMGLAVLAAGAWSYLRLKQPGKRLGALLLAILLAMGIMSLMIYILYPGRPSHHFPLWWEILIPLFDALTLSLMISAPILLHLLPRHDRIRPAVTQGA